jgi:hypothetical protein
VQGVGFRVGTLSLSQWLAAGDVPEQGKVMLRRCMGK